MFLNKGFKLEFKIKNIKQMGVASTLKNVMTMGDLMMLLDNECLYYSIWFSKVLCKDFLLIDLMILKDVCSIAEIILLKHILNIQI